MKILYSLKSTWEFEFIKNDIFENKYEISDFNYTDVNYYDNAIDLIGNCIIIFSTVSRSYVSNFSSIVQKLRPNVLFILSDEFGLFPFLTKLSNFTHLLLHNYNHINYSYNEKCIQLPLGYVSGFLKNVDNITSCKSIIDRKYNCSFVGEIKQDRQEMCKIFIDNMENTYITSNKNRWNIEDLDVKPEDLYNIYSNSIFVINGRGNKSLDCFRIYEAIVSGAIPVIMATEQEINDTFKYNGDIPFLVSDITWQKVLNKCLYLLKNKELLQTYQEFNFKWWNYKIQFIKEQIFKSIHS
jgi:hypothetical protein